MATLSLHVDALFHRVGARHQEKREYADATLLLEHIEQTREEFREYVRAFHQRAQFTSNNTMHFFYEGRDISVTSKNGSVTFVFYEGVRPFPSGTADEKHPGKVKVLPAKKAIITEIVEVELLPESGIGLIRLESTTGDGFSTHLTELTTDQIQRLKPILKLSQAVIIR